MGWTAALFFFVQYDAKPKMASGTACLSAVNAVLSAWPMAMHNYIMQQPHNYIMQQPHNYIMQQTLNRYSGIINA